MDGYDWIDREVAEEAWQESQDLMAEFGFQPDEPPFKPWLVSDPFNLSD
jgi:hypothetical protein